MSTHNKSVSRGTGLSPDVVHTEQYLRMPMTILEGRGVRGHQGLKDDHLDHLQLIRERRVQAYEVVRQEEFLSGETRSRKNRGLTKSANHRPERVARELVFVYDDKSTIAAGGSVVQVAACTTRMLAL